MAIKIRHYTPNQQNMAFVCIDEPEEIEQVTAEFHKRGWSVPMFSIAANCKGGEQRIWRSDSSEEWNEIEM